MAFTRTWRDFKRMEDLTAAAAALVFLAAALQAFKFQPGGDLFTAIVVWPALHLAGAVSIPLLVPIFRRLLGRYVWMSFTAGFGQTVASVIVGTVLLFAVGAALFRQIRLAPDALSLAPIFCAFAAGVGILVVQALLVRVLEQIPEVRAVIET